MTVRYNVSVRSFSFWGDAINTRCVLSDEQCDMVEMVLRNEYGEGNEEVREFIHSITPK